MLCRLQLFNGKQRILPQSFKQWLHHSFQLLSILVIDRSWLVVNARVFKYQTNVFFELLHVQVKGFARLSQDIVCGIHFSLNSLQVHWIGNHFKVVSNLLSVNWLAEGPAVILTD